MSAVIVADDMDTLRCDFAPSPPPSPPLSAPRGLGAVRCGETVAARDRCTAPWTLTDRLRIGAMVNTDAYSTAAMSSPADPSLLAATTAATRCCCCPPASAAPCVSLPPAPPVWQPRETQRRSCSTGGGGGVNASGVAPRTWRSTGKDEDEGEGEGEGEEARRRRGVTDADAEADMAAARDSRTGLGLTRHCCAGLCWRAGGLDCAMLWLDARWPW